MATVLRKREKKKSGVAVYLIFATPGFLPGKPPWTEEPGGLHSMVSQKVGHD